MPRLVRLVLALVPALAMPAAAEEPVTAFSGSATYLERMALPEEAELAVALREAAAGTGGREVASMVRPTEGAQVPLPFRLEVPTRKLVPDTPYAVEVGIRLGDGFRWLSDLVIVEAAGETVDVGEVRLRPATPMAFATTFRCGDVTARFGVAGDRAALEVDGRTFALVQTAAASGARYEAEDDPATVFWTKGEEARLEIAGEALPTCTAVQPVSGGEALTGKWTVLSIGGTQVLEEAPSATLEFLEEGQLAGRASCNRYNASLAVNGDRLAVGPQIAVTQMACEPDVLEQERRFLDALAAATAFAIDETGALVLSGGEEIVATRAAQE